MAQLGDRINYVGDGNNGTTAATAYSGVLIRLTGPGGWGPTDISIVVGGTPTIILNAPGDSLLQTMLGTGTQPNGTWRLAP